MCDCHKKKTFKEFGFRDAGYDFRCKECGKTVEIRGWMRYLMNFVWFMATFSLFSFFKMQGSKFCLEDNWGLFIEIPIVIAIGYVYLRVVGYWLSLLAWKLAEKDW